jgi:hypothetical protein
MEILMRKKGDRRWTKVKQQQFHNESALQNMIYQSPEVIPIDTLGDNLPKPILFVKEAGLPGSGYTDLIGVDRTGGITIVECKLATNPEIRRKVLGQVLEYAAYLWQMQYDQFERMCCLAEGWNERHLVDVMADKIGDTIGSWSAEEFKDNVASTLERGEFRLIIAVDRITDELKRVTQFLNSRTGGSPQIHVLEMRQFETEDLQMVVPDLFGAAPIPPTAVMNEQEFMKQGNNSSSELYSSLKKLAITAGYKTSSFTRHGYALRDRKRGNILVLYPRRLEMWFGPHYPTGYFDDETDRQFWEMMSRVKAFQRKTNKKNPGVDINEQSWTTDDTNSFVKALIFLSTRL